jgi:membrane-associated protease RseP (regulator of RpoE activity)
MDPVAEWDQVRATRWQEIQDEVVDMSLCIVAAHNCSLHTGFAAVHHKTFGLLG